MILTLEAVRYRYPGAIRDALQDVSLSVTPGQFHAVLGPNGSGKTTLGRIALGAVPPLMGRADVNGRSASQRSRRELAPIAGLVPRRQAIPFPPRARRTCGPGRYRHFVL